MVAVGKHLRCSSVDVSCNRVEQLFIRINTGQHGLVLGAVYIPPAANPSIYLDHSLSVDEILLKFPSDKILLVGDYNTSHILWSLDSCDVAIPALSVRASNADKLVLDHIL